MRLEGGWDVSGGLRRKQESLVVSHYPPTKAQETMCVGVRDGLLCFYFAEEVVAALFKFTSTATRQLSNLHRRVSSTPVAAY